MNAIRIWTISGFFAVCVVGSCLHYAYEFSGNSRIIGAFVPINESVWEHLKLGLWALILFAFLEYHFLADKVNNYFTSKALAILSLSITILLVYYGYRFFVSHSILLIDISSFFLGSFIAHWIMFKTFKYRQLDSLNKVSLVLIIAICLLFAIFSFHPPHYGIFKDYHTNTYGIDMLQ